MIKLETSLVVLIALCCSLALVSGTKYNICDQGKTESDVSNVLISECETLTDTCPFIRGFNKSIELDFTPKKKFELVKVKVAGKLSTLPVPFHINPDNACGNYGFDCPVEAGKPYKFKMSMPIMRTYPKINVDVYLRLVDENGNIIACVEMPARIQDPPK